MQFSWPEYIPKQRISSSDTAPFRIEYDMPGYGWYICMGHRNKILTKIETYCSTAQGLIVTAQIQISEVILQTMWLFIVFFLNTNSWAPFY